MYGALISAGVGLAGTLITQRMAAKEKEKAMEELEKQGKNMDDWYWNTKGDKTERADIRELGRMVQESVMERNEAAANPIAQNTAEGQAAVRAQNAQDITNYARTTTAELAKEDAENDRTHMTDMNKYSEAMKQVHNEKAAEITKAGQQLTNMATNVAGKFVDNGVASYTAKLNNEKLAGTDDGSSKTGTGGNLFDSMFS